MVDLPSSTVRLTKIRKPEARSAVNQPVVPVTQQASWNGGGDGDVIAQKARLIAPAGPLSKIAGYVKMPRSTENAQEERGALLSNVDSDGDSLSSTHTGLLFSQTSRSTLTESFPEAEVDAPDIDSDTEAALEALPRVAPDQFIRGYESTKWEIWAYYGYYIGNSGLTLATFAPMAMQNLISRASDEVGVVPFLGRDRTVNSVALLTGAISFSLQMALFLILGSFADFGNWRSRILIIQSLIGIAIGFAWLAVYNPEQWQTAIIMTIVGGVAFQISTAYFYAAFPALARNTPALRKKAEELNAGIIEREEYDQADSAARNYISNMSLWIAGAGGIGVIAVMMGILQAVDATADASSNSWAMSVLIGFGSAVWLVFAIPWFFWGKRRPGQSIPPGLNIITAGFWQVYRAASQITRLKQSLAYLIGYFILNESLSTSVSVISILQNQVVEYDITQLLQFVMMQYASATIGVWVCMKVQKRYSWTTKAMLCGVAVCIILMNIWGMLGIWSDTIGYHNVWEFWVWGFWYGCLVSPWYSYSQTMISEITPRGKESLFFSLFNIIGKASSFVGPLLSSIIIDTAPSHNPSLPFGFLVVLSILSMGIIGFFVDVKKSQKEQDRFLQEEHLEKVAMAEEVRQKARRL